MDTTFTLTMDMADLSVSYLKEKTKQILINTPLLDSSVDCHTQLKLQQSILLAKVFQQ
jgi:hypothetical protein